ncbi:MAG: FAD-dependent oxidoreductase [Candidatus Eisenbacteria bacterium]
MDGCFSMDHALREAARCLLCHDAPCSTACPAVTEPDRFIRKLRFKNIKGAAALVKKNNLLGGVCGAICPTSCLCEEGCLATGIGTPIAIGKIQKFLVEYGWQVGLPPVAAGPSNGRKVAVIGAGPSGLTCAGELAREGYEVTVFEKLSRPGGMLTYVIPEHRLSGDLVEKEIAEIVNLGVEIRCDSPMESQSDLERLLADGFEALYVATGAWKCATLGVPGAGPGDIFDAISFLTLAKADRAKFAGLVQDKDVAVVGGGDSAMDAAVIARKNGARDVYVVYRRSYAQMPASQEAKDEALSAGVHLLFLTQPVSYPEDGKVQGMRVVRCALCEPDKSGRRRPVQIDGTEHVMPVDLIVEAPGPVPADSMARFSSLDLSARNCVIVDDDTGATSEANIFAGGDAVRGASLVVRAVGDGKRAARAIHKALEKTVDRTAGEG